MEKGQSALYSNTTTKSVPKSKCLLSELCLTLKQCGVLVLLYSSVLISILYIASECNDHGVLMANSTQLCECEAPYIGNHCQYCSNGYYGDPRYVYIHKLVCFFQYSQCSPVILRLAMTVCILDKCSL